MAECAAQAVQLIDQVEDDADALVVDADVALQVLDQAHPGEIDLGELLQTLLGARGQPAGRHPGFQHIGLDACADEKLAVFHAHASIWRGLSLSAGRHCAMNFSSSGSGLAGSITLSVTYSSPRLPPLRGTPFPFNRNTLPVLDHLGTVMATAPSGVGTLILPPSTASRSEIGSSTWMSSPLRVKMRCGRIAISTSASPGGPPLRPAMPLPRRRRICPSRVPAGIETSSTEPSGIVTCRLAPLTASRKSSSRR